MKRITKMYTELIVFGVYSRSMNHDTYQDTFFACLLVFDWAGNTCDVYLPYKLVRLARACLPKKEILGRLDHKNSKGLY